MIIYKIPSFFNVDIYYCGEVINNFALHIEHIEVSNKYYPTLARIKVCEELFTFEKRKVFFYKNILEKDERIFFKANSVKPNQAKKIPTFRR